MGAIQQLLSSISPGSALAITRISANSAQATSVNFSTAPTAGDLIIVMAHRDGNTTAPTKVTGYTTIDNTTGANTNSAILAFKFSDGTETGTGVWTNATSVAVLIYRNAGLGGWSKTRTAGTTSPMTYGTLTMQQTSGTSWIAGFGATKASTDVGTNAPSGMTTRTSATDIAAFDSGAGAASWSAQTAAVNGTPGGTISYTVELMAVPVGQLLFTKIQHATTVGPGGATTAAVTLTQAVGSHPHILLVSTQWSGFPVDVVSIDKGGTLIPIVATGTGTPPSGWGASHGYVIGTTTATSPITVTYKQTDGDVNLAIWEVAYTGVGTPALDFADRTYVNSGTSVLGPAITMSSANGCVFQTIRTDNNVTAVSSPYNSPTGHSAFSGTNGGWCAAFNQTSYSQPTYTINTTGVSGFCAVGFGLNPTAFQTLAICDFEASTDGTACTEALLKASMKGWHGGQWSITGTAMKFESDASKPFVNAISRLNDGTALTAGAGSLGVEYLTATNMSYLKLDFDPNGGAAHNNNSYSAGIWFRFNLPANDTSNFDVFSIYSIDPTNFANVVFQANGGATSRTIRLETVSSSSVASVDLAPDTWYWLALLYNRATNHKFRLYDTSLNLVGSEIVETFTGGGNMPGYILIGNSIATSPTTGYKFWFDSLKVDPTGTWPILP